MRKQQVIWMYRICHIGAADWRSCHTWIPLVVTENKSYLQLWVIFCIHDGASLLQIIDQSLSTDWNVAIAAFKSHCWFSIRGSVPIKIWDSSGLSFWYLHSRDFFFSFKEQQSSRIPQGSTHQPLCHLSGGCHQDRHLTCQSRKKHRFY